MLRFALSAAIVISVPPFSTAGPAAAKPAAGKPEISPSGARPKKAKVRTLKQLIELALARGEAEDIPADMAELMGFGAVDTPTKGLRYAPESTPDGKEHHFAVILGKDDAGRSIPKAISMTVVEGKKSDGSLILDGHVFRVSVTGSLEKALHNFGKFGEEVDSEETAITDTAIKDKFKAELDFHLRKSARLGLEPAR